MKVVVLGYGIEGQASAAYWQQQGHEVSVRDANDQINAPEGFELRTGQDYLNDLEGFDLIVRTQSVRPWLITEANPGLSEDKITTSINEFLKQCPAPVIGVTGTKGKGTTSALITAILKAAGKTVWLGGNIGTSPLDFLDQINPEGYVVLELSSFQLMDTRHSPQTAVMLMIAPDHMDWHRSMGEYMAAKANIFKYQQPSDRAIYNACNLYSLRAGEKAPSNQVPFHASGSVWVENGQIRCGDHTICSVDEVGLRGRHNWDNICAAIGATWPIVQDANLIAQVVRQFTGLEHRLQKVGDVNGATYYDDSFSTNPETTVAALQAFTRPKVVILGGSDKGADYSRLAEEVMHNNVRTAILIGATAPQIKAALDKVGFDQIELGTPQMGEIVQLAASKAEVGDVVLLSPGCASFGLFANYKDRGNQFQEAVKVLQSE
jgi:UDP-N-acetylmuramoylalanine--D-glutamate ligase